MCVWARACVHAYVCVCVNLCVCVHVCVRVRVHDYSIMPGLLAYLLAYM